MKTLSIVSLSAMAILLSFCSVVKREHMPGYYVAWKHKALKPTTTAQLRQPTKGNMAVAQSQVKIEENNDVISLSADAGKVIPATTLKFHALPSVMSKKQLGRQFQTENSEKKEQIVSRLESFKHKSKQAAPAKGYSQIVALILVILVGVLGIHRFYLGYTGIGILMLLTGGVCGVLALIDLIRIIIGDLKPLNAEYSETLGGNKSSQGQNQPLRQNSTSGGR